MFACRPAFRVRVVLVAFLVALLSAAPPVSARQERPFLIVREDMYEELRGRAAAEPWKSIAKGAVEGSRGELGYRPGWSFLYTCQRLTEFASDAALAYILEEDGTKKRGYVDSIVDAITVSFPKIAKGAKAGNHDTMVVPGWTFFNAVLAADIIHDDMTPSQRTAVDAALRPVAEFFINAPLQWPLNVYGARLIWGLYQDDETLAEAAAGDYVGQLYREISPDGVFRAGPSYSAFRMAGANLAKTYSIDVLAFTGRKNLYEDPRLVSLYEWTYGYGVTPFGTFYTFGDSGTNGPDGWSPRARSAHRFSQTAATSAAWAMRNVKRPDTETRNALLAYVLMDEPMPAPAAPPGRIFPDGGAWFLERKNGREALGGALNNLKTQYQDHMHKDANAVHLVAYGEDVVRNSGYRGWGQGGLGFGWEYVNATAKSSNTVTVDGQDFESRPGGGITEGFTGTSFDYASGKSGPGLSNGVHERNFCFAHPTDAANGYFVLFDEVFSSGGGSADMYLHPNSDDAETEASLERYRWPVGSFKRKDLDVRRTDNDVNVTVFLATPPDAAEIENGLLASWDSSFVGEYLHATYPVKNGNARFATVIFPHDRNHPRPAMARIGVSGKYTGARIEHGGDGGATDFVVQPLADFAERTIGDIDGRGVSASGAAVWFRMKGDSVESFFFRKGKLFEAGGIRFETRDAASLLVEGDVGRIISEGTSLEVERATPTGFDVFLDGSAEPLGAVDSGENWIEVAVPAGSHGFRIARRPPAAPAGLAATAGAGKVRLAWDAPDDSGVTGYMLRDCAMEAGGSCSGWVGLPASATSHAVSGLRVGTPYRFELYALGTTGKGASSFATATPLPRSYESLARSPVPPAGPPDDGDLENAFPAGEPTPYRPEPSPPVNY